MLALNAKKFLKPIPHHPGVYQMLSAHREVLYVGKAKDLRKRLASYFRSVGLHPRTQSFLAQVVDITTIVTATESEALLLEYSLIKSLKPRYNVLLKDDKSYPYLFLSSHPYPTLAIYRGALKEKGFYFGPFPSTPAVHETLLFLQKLFKLRQCKDNVFKTRSRPCLQYQIGRCTAPCVGDIDAAAYARNVDFVKMFLAGKSKAIIDDITKLMLAAARQLDFEQAAYYRNLLASLQEIKQRQLMIQSAGDIDIIALAISSGYVCVDVLMVRGGLVLGNKTFCNESLDFLTPSEILTTFATQYYQYQSAATLPQSLLFSESFTVHERASLTKGLELLLQRKINLVSPPRAKKYRQWLELALANAAYQLQQTLAAQGDFAARLQELQQALALTATPERIACFDVSHSSGEATVVSCVVFTAAGRLKDAYRHYNIKNAAVHDDYGALREALQRHFTTTLANSASLVSSPEVLMVDGGKGQLQVAVEVLGELKVRNVFVLAIAKGEARKRGAEKIYFAQAAPSHATGKLLHAVSLTLPAELFTFLLRVRDEAHRFAITAQRGKLRRTRITSSLESITGIGKKRRNLLLQHFGGLQGIKQASIEELEKVRGIDPNLARRVYVGLHDVGK